MYHGPARRRVSPPEPYNKPMANARDLSADLLLRLEQGGGRIRDALDRVRGRLPDPRERGLLTELSYGVVRRRGTLDALLGAFCKRPVARLNAAVHTALRLGLYQIVLLDRIPSHAAVDHAVGWATRHAGPKRAGFVNGVLRTLLRHLEGPAAGKDNPRRDVPREDGSAVRFERNVFPDPATNLPGNFAARYGMPQWLVERWLAQWGEVRCRALLRAGLARPPMTLRARGERAALEALLTERGVPFAVGPGPQAVRVEDGEAARKLVVETAVAAVQDASSQRVAPLLDIHPGARVLDLCAAPGGKTLHLADLLGTGTITACDIEPRKIEQLEGLRPQMGEVQYEVVALDPDAPLPFGPASFDAILVDAPCTNTGVLRRRVEARWRLKAGDIGALGALQGALLDRCVEVLAPGGRLVYSTCSLEPEEDEDVVTAFLERHPTFSAGPAKRTWPTSETDGGFVALLLRGG